MLGATAANEINQAHHKSIERRPISRLLPEQLFVIAGLDMTIRKSKVNVLNHGSNGVSRPRINHVRIVMALRKTEVRYHRLPRRDGVLQSRRPTVWCPG